MDEPVIEVFHSMLARTEDSAFQSYCPICGDGILLMRRDYSGKLVSLDSCTFCGQPFWYVDLRVPEGALAVACEESE